MGLKKCKDCGKKVAYTLPRGLCGKCYEKEVRRNAARD